MPDDTIPQTDQVFDAPKLVIQSHKWQQEGYHITDVCNPKRPDCHSGGLPIGYGNMLTINKDGNYDIVPETRSQE